MKKFLSILLATAFAFEAQAQQKPAWQTIATTSIGKEAARTPFISYHNRDEALAGNPARSEYYTSLNGQWKYSSYVWSAGAAEPASEWTTATLPSKPAAGPYTYNPDILKQGRNGIIGTLESITVKRYSRTIDVPLKWLDSDVYLRITDGKSAVEVIVNGQKAGYAEDMKTGVEFNITRFLTDGQNTLVLNVYAKSTGSMLEAYDYESEGGIMGDVYILTQPKTHIADFRIMARLAPDNKAELALAVDVVNTFTRDDEVIVHYELLNAKGDIVKYYYTDPLPLAAQSKDTVHFAARLSNIKPWSAESPELYTLVLRLKKEGRYIEYIPFKIGFRNVEIRDGQLLVNNNKVWINGINFNQYDRDEASLRKTLAEFKRNNINAIRCGNHPQGTPFYRLCDELGFYVCDQANVDPYFSGMNPARGGSVGNDPAWRAPFMERTQDMFGRDKNFTCVVMWSLGNNAADGYNFYETYNWLSAADTTARPVIFSEAGLQWNTDIVCPRVPDPAKLDVQSGWTIDRPVIFSDSPASDLKSVYEALKQIPNFQGGFANERANLAELKALVPSPPPAQTPPARRGR